MYSNTMAECANCFLTAYPLYLSPMENDEKIPTRNEVPDEYKWDLGKLYASEDEWEADFAHIPQLAEEFEHYNGRLSESDDVFLQALQADEALDRAMEKVFHYASLCNEADQGDTSAQEKYAHVMALYTSVNGQTSFFVPQLLQLPDAMISRCLEDERFADYKVYVQKLLRQKAHILSEKEERILALEVESAQTASNAFSLLTDVDMDFGELVVEGKRQPLTHSTYSVLMESPDRAVRQEAYQRFYGVFASHANTLAALYAGQVKTDIFHARARGFPSCLEAALYPDKVRASVYHNLIDTVHKNLTTLHRYYELRRKVLGLDTLCHWDVYVPLVEGVKTHITYDQAVEIVRTALAPLGEEYTSTLCSGLTGGWVDRFENKGKNSGAFSSGCYEGFPYILMNYKESSLRDVYTMAHEGGHSMHSWYSVRNNPFPSYEYTIFEAEVASTFNEQLVFEHLLKSAGEEQIKRYLLAMRAADIVATLHRQTMFAEYELACHEAAERGEALTTDFLRRTYRALLEAYFGSSMVFEKESDMEGLRIPHFYNAFYVYKYSTGIAAALALSQRVTSGGEKERDDYFTFLKSGGSRYPIESLRLAGVDMESTESIQTALDVFAHLVDELEAALL